MAKCHVCIMHASPAPWWTYLVITALSVEVIWYLSLKYSWIPGFSSVFRTAGSLYPGFATC